mgnify:CR=1 FL=1
MRRRRRRGEEDKREEEEEEEEEEEQEKGPGREGSRSRKKEQVAFDLTFPGSLHQFLYHIPCPAGE